MMIEWFMANVLNDDELCRILIEVLAKALPDLEIQGGADEPFYEASKDGKKAILYFRENYPRSLLHELHTTL